MKSIFKKRTIILTVAVLFVGFLALPYVDKAIRPGKYASEVGAESKKGLFSLPFTANPFETLINKMRSLFGADPKERRTSFGKPVARVSGDSEMSARARINTDEKIDRQVFTFGGDNITASGQPGYEQEFKRENVVVKNVGQTVVLEPADAEGLSAKVAKRGEGNKPSEKMSKVEKVNQQKKSSATVGSEGEYEESYTANAEESQNYERENQPKSRWRANDRQSSSGNSFLSGLVSIFKGEDDLNQSDYYGDMYASSNLDEDTVVEVLGGVNNQTSSGGYSGGSGGGSGNGNGNGGEVGGGNQGNGGGFIGGEDPVYFDEEYLSGDPMYVCENDVKPLDRPEATKVLALTEMAAREASRAMKEEIPVTELDLDDTEAIKEYVEENGIERVVCSGEKCEKIKDLLKNKNKTESEESSTNMMIFQEGKTIELPAGNGEQLSEEDPLKKVHFVDVYPLHVEPETTFLEDVKTYCKDPEVKAAFGDDPEAVAEENKERAKQLDEYGDAIRKKYEGERVKVLIIIPTKEGTFKVPTDNTVIGKSIKGAGAENFYTLSEEEFGNIGELPPYADNLVIVGPGEGIRNMLMERQYHTSDEVIPEEMLKDKTLTGAENLVYDILQGPVQMRYEFLKEDNAMEEKEE